MEKVQTDNFTLYLKYLLMISFSNLLVRLGTAVGFSKLWGVDFKVEKVMDVLPVLSYSESNVVLFKKISTLSLIFPSVFMFVGFLYVVFFSKNENKHVLANCWFIGVFLTLLQYAFALFLDHRIQFVNDWRGLLVVVFLVVISTAVYFSKVRD